MVANDLSNPRAQAPHVLSVDTSSRSTSVSVAHGRSILATLAVQASDRRSERLWAEMEFVLGEANLRIQDVDVFAVCVGPGGFTGIRVGLAAVKGLARATGKPIVAVSSLEAAALTAVSEGEVCVLLNAYRGDVYSQLFRVEFGKLPEPLNSADVSSGREAIDRVAHVERVAFVGDWALDHQADLKEACEAAVVSRSGSGDRKWTVAPYSGILSIPAALAGLMKYESGEVASPRELNALYVRPSEAEIKLSKGLVGPGLGLSRKPGR